MYHAIKILKIRGAPAIGIAAAFGVFWQSGTFLKTVLQIDFLTILEKNMIICQNQDQQQ
jgi:methylthioribose-1-phosphate isomerase